MKRSEENAKIAHTEMTLRRWWTFLILIVVFALAVVATTHRVFSQTADEGWHLVTGYDVLKRHDFKADLHHPPLARVFFALPFLDSPNPEGATTAARGNELLLRNDRYTQNLGRARVGNLPFLALAIIVVAVWARRLFSPATGLIAAVIFAALPPVLAHAGFATTDMSIAATLPLALYALTLFLEQATWKRSVLLGLAIAAGALSKYSFLLYFPCAAAALLLVRRKLPSWRVLASLVVAFVLVWGVYGFSFSSLAEADSRAEVSVAKVFEPQWIAHVPVPAPLYAMGAIEVKIHDIEGHKAFLFGEQRTKGWWYYFPVALFFKTPIPLLVLTLAGFALLLFRRKGVEILLITLAILGAAMTGHINIGIRHVLPIYGPMAIAAAFAVTELRRFRIITAALLAWLLIGTYKEHPDYLPWFNAFAGQHPERILSDSNIDWGQDILRLVRYARREKIPHLTISLAPDNVAFDRIGLPPHTMLEAWKPLYGWVAVSEFQLAQGRGYNESLRAWVDEWFTEGKPFIRIGKSIRLYRFPEKPASTPPAV
jgi:hypothetical protein